MDKGGVCHDFHPGLHFFGCIGAEIVRPHIGVSGLAGREIKRESKREAAQKKFTFTSVTIIHCVDFFFFFYLKGIFSADVVIH